MAFAISRRCWVLVILTSQSNKKDEHAGARVLLAVSAYYDHHVDCDFLKTVSSQRFGTGSFFFVCFWAREFCAHSKNFRLREFKLCVVGGCVCVERKFSLPD